MQLFAIGEISKMSGVESSTIRYYERIGLLPPSKRVNTKRRYDSSILEKLGLIRMARSAGLTIAEIQALLNDFPIDTPPSERWQSLAVKKIVELDEVIKRVQVMKTLLERTLQCHCSTLDHCAGIEENILTGKVDVKPQCGIPSKHIPISSSQPISIVKIQNIRSVND